MATATAYQIHVSPSNSGLLNPQQTEASASKVTELLQKDLETHHVFFNNRNFHNHIVHHLLAVYGTGGSPDALQLAYDDNTSYQKAATTPHNDVVEKLQADWAANAPKYLGSGEHYSDFLKFFQQEIEKHGWQAVVEQYVFKGDERGDDLLGRLYGGIFHPLIQLMYGIEWQQPSIVAEGLAQASVHVNRYGDSLIEIEKAAATRDDAGSRRTMPELLAAAREDPVLGDCARYDDENLVMAGPLGRARQEAIAFLGQVSVKPEELDERTVEMMHTLSWMAASAATHPPYVPKYDFPFIHHLNSSPAFTSFNKQDWIPTKTKVRLLEWKIRMDIIQYLARGAPPLSSDTINGYAPRDATLAAAPEDLVPRLRQTRDDGHTVKVVRAMLLARQLSRPYADRPWIRMAGDDMWLKALYLLLDAVNGGGSRWVFGCGFDEAWRDMPKAK